jgi:hypothetical protein
MTDYNCLQSLAKGLSFSRFWDPALFFDRILTPSIIKKWFFATAHRYVEFTSELIADEGFSMLSKSLFDLTQAFETFLLISY